MSSCKAGISFSNSHYNGKRPSVRDRCTSRKFVYDILDLPTSNSGKWRFIQVRDSLLKKHHDPGGDWHPGVASEVIGPITGIFDRAVGTTAKVGAFLQQGTDAVSRGKDLLGFEFFPRWMDVVGHFWEYGPWMFRWCNLCGLENMEFAVLLRSSSWTVRTWGSGGHGSVLLRSLPNAGKDGQILALSFSQGLADVKAIGHPCEFHLIHLLPLPPDGNASPQTTLCVAGW